MIDGYIIHKNKNLQEGISGNTLFECQFSDYELYQILESNGYKTTNKNKDILKNGLLEGRYYIEDELGALLVEDFKQYLNEDPIILREDILTEGKILNKIRWKLALFSLRFLSNTSINAFFIAYYADEDGEPTDKGREFCKKSRKEKLEKMRELANGMKEEDKNKVLNSQAAKMAEKSGIFSFISAGIAGVGAGIAAHTSNMYSNVSGNKLDVNDTDVNLNVDASKVPSSTTKGNLPYEDRIKVSHAGKFGDQGYQRDFVIGNGYESSGTIRYVNISSSGHGNAGGHFNSKDTTSVYGPGDSIIGGTSTNTSVEVNANATIGNKTANIFNMMSGVLASIASVLYGAMWGAIIVAGVSTVRGVLSFHKATMIRRNEIISELKGKMDLKRAKNLAKQYKYEFKAEKYKDKR